jgi:hypothetical protein
MPARLSFGRAAFVCFWLGWAPLVHAQTDEIQVYDAQIAAPGQWSLDLHHNFTPNGSNQPAFPGAVVPDRALNGVAEWAYGVTPWFEAGLYFPLYSLTRDNSLLYDGFKLRALFVSPDAATRDVFYGVNFEFSFNTAHWDEHRNTSEIRPIIGTHVGRFDVIFNPILDNAYTGLSNLDFAPESRVALEISKGYKVALEEYDDFGRIGHFSRAARQSHQLFGVFDANTRWLAIEVGLGAGLTSASDHRVLKLILMRDL